MTSRRRRIVMDMPADKQLATLVAAFALAGRVVRPTAAGGFTVASSNAVHHCRDREALLAHARLLGIV